MHNENKRMKNEDTNIKDLTKEFALRIIKLYQYLNEEAPRKEYVMSKQILRSGTSIGANVREGVRAQSKADFATKMNIALKEASETEYWLELLSDAKYLSPAMADSILEDCRRLNRILTSIVKTTFENIAAKK